MPAFTVDKEGVVLDSDGNQFQIDGEPVTIQGHAQSDLNAMVAKAKHKKEAEIATMQKDIDALNGIKERSAEMEDMLSRLKEQKEKAEADLSTAQQEAQRKVAEQMSALEKTAAEATAALEAERKAHLTTELTADILSHAGKDFHRPQTDIVPILLAKHKREPVPDPTTGEPTGEFKDLYVMEFPDPDSGKLRKEAVPAKTALGLIKSNPDYAHYVAGTGKPGSDGMGTPMIPGGGPKHQNDFASPAARSAWLAKEGNLKVFATLPPDPAMVPPKQ